METVKTCNVCYKTFIKNPKKTWKYFSNQKYCSRDCWLKEKWGHNYQHYQPINTACKQCNKKFIIPPQGKGIYCSSKCHYLGARNRIVLICEQCGNNFEKTPGELRHANGSKGRFCSLSCCWQWQKKNIKLNIRCCKTCIVCGIVFYVTKSGAQRKCCSKNCGWQTQRKPDSILRKNLRDLAKHHKRRQLMRARKTDITTSFLVNLWNSTDICVECGNKMENHCQYPLGRNLDHIIQLSKGGLHMQNNVRYIHAICNFKRH
jgi:hypothetical protein